MSCFPKIDQPCPLGVDAQKRLNGYCGQCRKTVHALDGLDGAARASLLAGAGGPICVSYRVPARLGAALMLSMVGAAFAGDQAPAPVASAPVETSTVLGNPQVDELPKEAEYVLVGGVSAPESAEWVDTDVAETLPELPVIVDDAP